VGPQGSASGSLLLDLDGLEVVEAELVGGEWQLAVQTTDTVVGCVGCGVRATPHGRRLVRVRDLPLGGRPAGPRRSLGMSVHAGVIPGRGGSAPRIGADSYRPPNASAIRTASSFLTSASGRGWSTGKCSDPLVDV